ncbi:hypothetical protein FA13DRAFT_87247 [Coprinellus micaceus]|uniref:Secreted protein n=1 Tax=Coprinellus micaceus TaxID=71717 RepID=A0A4Y7SJ82_COPMI|nr:hypothetical protein FA13DRAFT_87247 [Coprinellus micaceus]
MLSSPILITLILLLMSPPPPNFPRPACRSRTLSDDSNLLSAPPFPSPSLARPLWHSRHLHFLSDYPTPNPPRLLPIVPHTRSHLRP